MTTEQLIDRIARIAASGDGIALQQAIGDLKRLMIDEGRPLSGSAAFRLVDALSSGAMLAGGREAAPYYSLIDQIKKLSNRKHAASGQIDMIALRTAWDSLYELLARAEVESEAVHEVLLALQSARIFDLAARTADRALVRHPDDAVVRCAYGQALIDSGQAQAGIDMLGSVLRIPGVAKAERDRAQALLGRAYKQIYVDHVSEKALPSVRHRFRPYLEKAIAAYGSVFDVNRPGDCYWAGVNLVALFNLANEDGHTDIANPTGIEAAEIARRLVASIEPQTDTTTNPWLFTSIGQAYLALRDYERAARYFGAFARAEDTDDFMLNGTIRQLEQVWRIHPGHAGGGAILAVLKAAQIAQPDSKFTLNGHELRELSSLAASAEYAFAETMVKGGSFMKLAQLQLIVGRAQSVAAVCDEAGATMGSGFLIRGGDLHERLGDDLYLLTNAHVMSDPAKPGAEPRSLHPERTRLKLEAASGTEIAFDPKVIWQSPVAEYDAALVRIDPGQAGIAPLPLADRKHALTVEDAEQRIDGTRVSVIGHPQGGPLSLSLVGTLSGANGVLVDAGPRSAAGSDPSYLHYRAPTEPGNSGSPVFETDGWTVIGLHHMGFDPFTGRPRLKGKPGTNFANQGVCIQSIRKAIATDTSSAPKRGLLGRSRGG